MKKVKVQDAVGLTLCHDITAMRDGFKGAAFKRGHVIEEGDVEKLLDLGKRTVFIWEENAGEIHEEDAARRMAAMAQVEGCHYTEPSEGKVLLMADTRGMFRVDTALLNQVNSIGDLTISTLPDHFPVEAGDRLASMRIVPLVTQETQVIEAERLCQGKKLLDLRPYHARKAGVIITGSEIYTGRIKDKFEPVVPGEARTLSGRDPRRDDLRRRSQYDRRHRKGLSGPRRGFSHLYGRHVRRPGRPHAHRHPAARRGDHHARRPGAAGQYDARGVPRRCADPRRPRCGHQYADDDLRRAAPADLRGRPPDA